MQSEIFVFEFRAVNGFSTGAIMIGEVATLAHEIGNNSMESTAAISESFLAGAQCTKIFRGLRNDITP